MMLSSYPQKQQEIDQKQQLRNKIKSLQQEIIQRTRNFMHHQKNNNKKQNKISLEVAIQTQNQTINNITNENNNAKTTKNLTEGDENQSCTSHSSKNICNSQENSPSNFTAILPNSPQTQDPLSQSQDLQNLQSSLSTLSHDLKISKTRCQFITKALVQSQQTNYQLRIKLQETQKKLRQIGNGTKQQYHKQYQTIIESLKIKVQQMEIMKKQYLRAYSKIKQQKQQLQLSLLSQSPPNTPSPFLNSIPQLSQQDLQQTFRRTSASTTIGAIKQLIQKCLLQSNRSSSQKLIKTALLKLEQLQIQQIQDQNKQQIFKQQQQSFQQQQETLLKKQKQFQQKQKILSQQKQIFIQKQQQQLKQIYQQNKQQQLQWKQKQTQKYLQIGHLRQKDQINYTNSIESLHQHYKQLLLTVNKSYLREKQILQNSFNITINKIIDFKEKEKDIANGTVLPEIVMLKKSSKVHMGSNHSIKQTHKDKLVENASEKNLKYGNDNKFEEEYDEISEKSKISETDKKSQQSYEAIEETTSKTKLPNNVTVNDSKSSKIITTPQRTEREFKQFMHKLIHKFNQSNSAQPALQTQTDPFIQKISQTIFQTLCNLPTGEHGTILFPPSTPLQLLNSLQCLYNFSLSYDTIQQITQNSHNQQINNICKIIESIIQHHNYQIDGEFVMEIIRQKCLQGQINNASEFLKKIINSVQQKENQKKNKAN